MSTSATAAGSAAAVLSEATRIFTKPQAANAGEVERTRLVEILAGPSVALAFCRC